MSSYLKFVTSNSTNKTQTSRSLFVTATNKDNINELLNKEAVIEKSYDFI